MVATGVSIGSAGGVRASASNDEREILAALNAATNDARDVPKLGRNTHHHYDYATAEDMIIEAKKHLAAHGLSVLTGSTQIRPGVSAAPAVLAQQFSIVHKDHGELSLGEREWPIVPGEGRPFDKAFAAAHTALLAYFLRDLLQLARTEAGTSLDGDERDATHKKASKRRDLGAVVSKNNLVSAVMREYDRLEIHKDDRKRESVRLLGRAPTTLTDLSTLLRTLKQMARTDPVFDDEAEAFFRRARRESEAGALAELELYDEADAEPAEP